MTQNSHFSSARIAYAPIILVLMVLLAPCYGEDPQSPPSYSDPVDSEISESIDKSMATSKAHDLQPEPSSSRLATSTSDPQFEGFRKPGVDWGRVFSQSAFFLGIEQGFRLGTQPGTRNALKGEFFADWFKSVKSTKGWGDGDDFLTNYIGHPMMGSVSGNIFVQNDPRGRNQVFSWNSRYWNSRFKAMAWSAFYSTQFELGPISEASLGNVGSTNESLSGFVDLVITPIAGFGWQVGEDALDKYLIVRIETWTQNHVILMLARSFLNPTRSFANMMRLSVPWNRDTRPGIWQ
jgi:hypothetical protein